MKYPSIESVAAVFKSLQRTAFPCCLGAIFRVFHCYVSVLCPVCEPNVLQHQVDLCCPFLVPIFRAQFSPCVALQFTSLLSICNRDTVQTDMLIGERYDRLFMNKNISDKFQDLTLAFQGHAQVHSCERYSCKLANS